MREPIGQERKYVINAAKCLVDCLENNCDEDAHTWCQDIQRWLYAHEIRLRLKLEEAIKRGLDR